jgi:3-mercaptopyruvate sulfurtransferase SseA
MRNSMTFGRAAVPYVILLKYFHDYPNVCNYDGSWARLGNLVRTPIEKP